MRRISNFKTLVGLLFLGACSSLATSDKPTSGIPYFLPLTKIRYVINYDTPSDSHIETYTVADNNQKPYYLSYRENSFADENLCIDRTDTGLLKKIYFGSHDRLPDVVLNVLEIAARAGTQVEGTEQPEVERSRCSGGAVSEWMDPYDQQAIASFNSTLCNMKVEVPDFSAGEELAPQKCPSNGVCFVTNSDFQYSIRASNGKVLKTDHTAVASRRDIGWINIKSAFFNKRITLLDFTNGALTTVRIRKDSEILGLSELPLNAVERLLAVPGNAIGMAFSGYQERLVYLQQRKALQEAGATATKPSGDPDDSIETKVEACKAAG